MKKSLGHGLGLLDGPVSSNDAAQHSEREGDAGPHGEHQQSAVNEIAFYISLITH